MKEKIWNHLCWVVNSVILAGIILLFIGLYYSVIKAGIPYQDPPLELQIQYAVNTRIGEILLGNGFVIAIWGGVIRVCMVLLRKMLRRK